MSECLVFSYFYIHTHIYICASVCVWYSFCSFSFFLGCVDGRISFKKQIGKKIAMHNMHSFHTTNPLKCFHECEERQNCLSAELKKYKKLCHLSQTAHYLTDKNLFVDSPNTLYFEKICKRKFYYQFHLSPH